MQCCAAFSILSVQVNSGNRSGIGCPLLCLTVKSGSKQIIKGDLVGVSLDKSHEECLTGLCVLVFQEWLTDRQHVIHLFWASVVRIGPDEKQFYDVLSACLRSLIAD